MSHNIDPTYSSPDPTCLASFDLLDGVLWFDTHFATAALPTVRPAVAKEHVARFRFAPRLKVLEPFERGVRSALGTGTAPTGGQRGAHPDASKTEPHDASHSAHRVVADATAVWCA